MKVRKNANIKKLSQNGKITLSFIDARSFYIRLEIFTISSKSEYGQEIPQSHTAD